ncbi:MULTISPECIES: glutathione S-transferase family protein [Nostocales]|uniref:Glutathione S-transferase family protein n=3 Tax=Nostocales TaxID=1161 RepID=A0A0C1R9L4_9CYAN|nr:glutathione S-transferase family protein [Tolypothrix bouteillei]KAF3890300.1 glutathione S-transferase family protein [Tolypothrix bouteillei VB521301]
MLKLYHNPISFNSRRVWIALLEKELEFELVEIKLDGDQLQPEFLAKNPFHHIPVLEDDDFTIVESLAILDYLEAKYPKPTFIPTDARAIATMRMVEMVTVNELLPAMTPLINRVMGFPGSNSPEKLEQAKQKAATVFRFLEDILGNDLYLVNRQFTLADIVAGTVVPLFPSLGFPLIYYPKLSSWAERLMQRPSWQTTQASPEAIEAFKARFKGQ